MDFHSGFEVLEDTNQIPIIPTGDDTLDTLLEGGFRKVVLEPIPIRAVQSSLNFENGGISVEFGHVKALFVAERVL